MAANGGGAGRVRGGAVVSAGGTSAMAFASVPPGGAVTLAAVSFTVPRPAGSATAASGSGLGSVWSLAVSTARAAAALSRRAWFLLPARKPSAYPLSSACSSANAGNCFGWAAIGCGGLTAHPAVIKQIIHPMAANQEASTLTSLPATIGDLRPSMKETYQLRNLLERELPLQMPRQELVAI